MNISKIKYTSKPLFFAMRHRYLLINLILFSLLSNTLTSNAEVFDTISVSVFDSSTGIGIPDVQVFIQIPSSDDPDYSYYMANYAAQLPIIIESMTNTDGTYTYTVDQDAIGALKQAQAEGFFTDAVIEVRIIHEPYLPFHEFQTVTVDGQDLSLRFELQRETEPTSTGTLQKITIYVKDLNGNPISGARVTSTSQPSGQITLSGDSGSEGSIIFNDVIAGDYTFLASSDGYSSSVESFSTGDGNVFERTILLEKETSGVPGFPSLAIMIGLLLGVLIMSSTRGKCVNGTQSIHICTNYYSYYYHSKQY